jgi:cytochrome c553
MNTLLYPAIFLAASIIVITMARSSLDIQDRPDTNLCIGECYEAYVAANGTVVEQAVAQAQAAASMNPVELGKAAYPACAACHGPAGEGGVGPQLQGRDAAFITTALTAYKNRETRGAQSAMMWTVATPLEDADINNLAAYISSL